MIKVEVRDATVTHRTITSKGRQFTFHEQLAYAYTFGRDGKPKAYPEETKLNLDEGQEPYAPGQYALAPTSVWVGDFGRLTLSPRLVPVK
jgi:hypothetical protein